MLTPPSAGGRDGTQPCLATCHPGVVVVSHGVVTVPVPEHGEAEPAPCLLPIGTPPGTKASRSRPVFLPLSLGDL
jgi:hypothetical protein